jgi:hypothetical protein
MDGVEPNAKIYTLSPAINSAPIMSSASPPTHIKPMEPSTSFNSSSKSKLWPKSKPLLYEAPSDKYPSFSFLTPNPPP